MKTLIICIDRDNDIGEKAHIQSPVIGREANIQAAIALGLADPEDSDTNSIFGAVKVYEHLSSRGEDVEVITLAGDKRVGLESDRRIMEQLHKVVADTNGNEAILVSDGAEDEGLLGLMQSRIDVVGIERITVKQERKIEGLYYYIQKAIEDEKMRKIVIPLALILMAWGISMFFGLEGVMRGFILFLVGMYLILKTYHLEDDVFKTLVGINEQVHEGKFSWVFSFFSVVIFLIGFLRSLDHLRTSSYYEDDISVLEVKFILYIIIIINYLIWWAVFALLIREAGKFFDTIISVGDAETGEERSYWSHIHIAIFLIATGFIFNAGLNLVQFITDASSIPDFTYQWTMSMFFIGGSLFFGGRKLYNLRMEEEGYEGRKKRHLP